MPAKKMQVGKAVKAKAAKKEPRVAPPNGQDATRAMLNEILAALKRPEPQVPTVVSSSPMASPTDEIWTGLQVTNNEYTLENFMSKVNTLWMLCERLKQDVDAMKVQLGNVIQRVNAR